MPGRWREVEIVEGESDPELPRVYVRVGAIVPLGPVMQFSDEAPVDPLELLAVPDADGNAAGELYEDEGDGHAHVEGVFCRSRFTLTANTVRSERRGEFEPPARTIEVRVVESGAVRRGRGDADQPIRIDLG